MAVTPVSADVRPAPCLLRLGRAGDRVAPRPFCPGAAGGSGYCAAPAGISAAPCRRDWWPVSAAPGEYLGRISANARPPGMARKMLMVHAPAN